MWFFCTLTPPFMANAIFKVSVLEKSIRETVPTFRVELIVSTFPVPVIFSVSPTYTYTITYIYLQSKWLTYVFYLQKLTKIPTYTYLFLTRLFKHFGSFSTDKISCFEPFDVVQFVLFSQRDVFLFQHF